MDRENEAGGSRKSETDGEMKSMLGDETSNRAKKNESVRNDLEHENFTTEKN
jgi:hypothetical protein